MACGSQALDAAPSESLDVFFSHFYATPVTAHRLQAHRAQRARFAATAAKLLHLLSVVSSAI